MNKPTDIPPTAEYNENNELEDIYTPIVDKNSSIQGYVSVAYEGQKQNTAVFLACGTNGRLDRIYTNNVVENIPVPVSGRDLTQVLACPDITLVSGSSGVILYSYDGDEFYWGSGVRKTDVLGLAFFNGKYYACTQNGAILESGDGTAWKVNAGLADEAIISIAANQEYIMAITSATDIFVSEDGAAWRSENFNVAYDGYYEKYVFTGLVDIGNAFHILGYIADDPGSPIVMYSDSGGEVWMYRTLGEINIQPPEVFYPLTVNSLCVCGDELVAACNSGRVLTLTSCSKCNLITDAANVDLHGIAPGNGYLIMVGDNYEFTIQNASDFQYNEYIDE